MSYFHVEMEEPEYPDFTQEDDLSSVTLILEGQKLYVHREVLAAWSPVFKSMFTREFKEKDMREIELPGKTVDAFVELLHCMYPPIKAVSDSNVQQLLPLAEEYQIIEIKKKCEEFLLTKPGSIQLLVTAQAYGLYNLVAKCVECARSKTYGELKQDPYFSSLEPGNLISILELRVQDLEQTLSSQRKMMGDRDARLYGAVTDLVSNYGNFCTECKSRKLNQECFNCLKMYRDRVKQKCEEVKALRSQNPLL